MNSNPLVSIITPVYNHEKFIGDTINSIINQTYQNWEMLVVDDCSTDRSWEIIQEYAGKDSRIKAFRNTENKGLIPNWKFLIDNSKGEYIAFLEGDDIFYKNNLAKKIEIFEKFPDVGMVYCNFNVISENGEVIIKNHKLFQRVRVYKNEYIEPSEYLGSKYHLINSYSQVMIKRLVIKKTGYPRTFCPLEKIFLPSDWDFNFRISTENKIYYIEDILFGYRKHSSNSSYDAITAYRHMSFVLDDYRKKFIKNSEVIKAIQYKQCRYIYSKIIYYLENRNKKMAWNEFFSYIKYNIYYKDLDLNIKLICRLFFPNILNLYIKKFYYHQQ